MRFETTIRLMKAYSTCPKCGVTMMCDGFKSDENEASLECKCGWKLEVKESEVKEQ